MDDSRPPATPAVPPPGRPPATRGRAPEPRPGDLRAGDSDRERVAAVLGDALADGRLAHDEHEERLEAVYRARTLGELAAITADLLPPEAQPLRTDVRPVTAFFGSEERSGRWVVPTRFSATAVCANVTLDLCEALLQSSHVTLQVTVIGGTLTLIVPEGVRIEMPASLFLGGKKNQVRPAPDGPVIEITGLVSMGSVIAKSPKRPRRSWFRR
ncbi:hypothetical protein Ppa06_28450 [Planomonospora parontospora subsp. parontospora]|uniref:DUF1707 domain-containing protein n=2 Tax=Planomonospora parontospora TaxID=58119 RepID=A0AA37BGV9_9ACTN|nr:DUF1707 domain-containing protein [Planomonospora parontospora]GGK68335.1 hypothetical protein GCM10010126_29710 [Planomonospora parontospora]GII09047.1 hypothetical protein Ppa06_28450 [Planomonospora parontospora subsp. parontospora]